MNKHKDSDLTVCNWLNSLTSVLDSDYFLKPATGDLTRWVAADTIGRLQSSRDWIASHRCKSPLRRSVIANLRFELGLRHQTKSEKQPMHGAVVHRVKKAASFKRHSFNKSATSLKDTPPSPCWNGNENACYTGLNPWVKPSQHMCMEKGYKSWSK